MNTYIFDFDGTIADSFSHACDILITHADYLGCKKLTMVELLSLKELHAREVLRYLDIPLWRTASLVRKIRKKINEQALEITIFPGWQAILKKLNDDNHQIGLLSSNSLETVEFILNKYDVLDLFDFISCDQSLFGKKRTLRKLIHQKNFTLSNTYYIGDEVRDIEAAHAAKVQSIAVGWGFNSIARLQEAEPNQLAANIEELAHLFFN